MDNNSNQSNVHSNGESITTCSNCGASFPDDYAFCPRCGQKVLVPMNLGIDADASAEDSIPNSDQASVSDEKNAEEISADDSNGEVIPETSVNVDDQTKDDTVVTSIIDLKNAPDPSPQQGKRKNKLFIAIGAAAVVIVVAVILVVVSTTQSTSKFEDIYNEYCNSEWATLASDGSYLKIDTNPDDEEDYFSYAAYLAILSINDELGLPESLSEKMGSTSALDGRQTEEYDEITVSWKYHPDNGLEVIYELN